MVRVFMQFLLIATVLVLLPQLHGESNERGVVALYNRSAGPMTMKIASAFAEIKKQGGTAGVLLRPDTDANASSFVALNTPFDGFLAQHWPPLEFYWELAQRFPPARPCTAYLLGERRLAVIVNTHNDLNAIRRRANRDADS